MRAGRGGGRAEEAGSRWRWRLQLAAAGLLVLGLVVGVLGVMSAGAPARAAGSADPPTAEQAPGREVVELRTRTSRTYESPGGGLVARVFGGAVNFRDTQGRWQAIDSTLRRTAAGLENTANSVRVVLPEDLGQGPVRVQDEEGSVAFRLRDARGAAAVSGQRARYQPQAGVTVDYEAYAQGVKETITLADAGAPRAFAFDLQASSGLTPKLTAHGSLELRTPAGEAAFVVLPPFMEDAAGARSEDVAYTLDEQAGGWRVGLRAGERWLDDAARRWPVRIDPTVSNMNTSDCTLNAGAPTQNFCELTYLGVGQLDGAEQRALLRFDVRSALPVDAQIHNAAFALKLQSVADPSGAAPRVSARAVTRAWTAAGATWQNATSTTTWTNPGGDTKADPAPEAQAALSTQAGWYSWDVVEMARQWFDGRLENHGVLLQADALTNGYRFTSRDATADQPFIDVFYERPLGAQKGFKLETQRLSDRITLSVNGATGNLIVRQTDLTLPGGLGPDLQLGRTYNSEHHRFGVTGHRWTTDLGRDIQIERLVPNDGKLRAGNRNGWTLWGPTGRRDTFFERSGGGFTEPKGLDGQLSFDGNTPVVTDNDSQTQLRFASSGDDRRLVAMRDRNGREIRIDYVNSGQDRIVDARGQATTVDYSGSLTTAMTDPAGRTSRFTTTTDGTRRTTAYTDAAGGVTRYEYDGPGGRMSKVITPEGRQTRIAYFPSGDPNEGRVKSITRVTDETAQTGPTTTFTYTINRDGGTGEVTDPIGTSTSTAGDRVTKTTYDRDRRPTKTLDALGRERREEYTSNFDTTAIFDAFNTSTTPSVRLNYDAQTNTLLGTVAQTGGTRGELTTSNAYGEDGRVAATTPGKAYLPTSEVNEQNHTTWNTYDARGNLTRVDRRSGANSFSSVQLEYDPASPGKLTGTRDGNNNLTSYAYTTRGDLQTITPPAPLGATTLRYDGTSGADDALGRVSSITDPEGRRQAFTYDALDRIVRIDFSQNGTNASSTTFTYDKDGNQTRRDDSAHGITTYSFDRLGRLTGDDVPGGDFTSYGYDLASNLTSLRDAGGTTTYGYDAVNRPKSVLEPGASSAIAYRYDEDASKNDTLMALPNGVTVEERLDKAGRLLETCARQTSAPTCTPSSAGRLFQQRYDWSQASTNGTKARAVRQSVTDEDGTTTMYRYDELDRLIGAQMTNSAGTVTRDWGYGYDGASNITSIRRYDNVSGDETTVTSTYNAANQLVSFGGSTFTYDSAGNETATTRIRTSSRYNARGQLDRVLNYGGTTITSAYAGPGQAERTQSSGVNITYNALGISATGTSDPRRYVRDPNGRLLSQRNSTSHQYLLLDGIGSVRAGLTTGGSVAWWRDFDPYGEPITNGHPSPTTSRFGFAGGLYDIQSGIYHFGQRFYDPETGRWTQPDPLNQPADLRQANRYAYVGGDPVNLVDPTGTVLWIPGTACYIYTAARDRDNSLRDEIWDLNQCYNPWAWF